MFPLQVLSVNPWENLSIVNQPKFNLANVSFVLKDKAKVSNYSFVNAKENIVYITPFNILPPPSSPIAKQVIISQALF